MGQGWVDVRPGKSVPVLDGEIAVASSPARGTPRPPDGTNASAQATLSANWHRVSRQATYKRANVAGYGASYPGLMFQRLSFEDGDFRPVDPTSPDLRVAVVPVIVRDERGVRGLGSAFCVAMFVSGKALYVTARHVVSDALPEPIPEGYTRVSLSGGELFLLLPGGLGSIAEANALQGVLIEDISLAPNHSDIALVTVDISDFSYPPTTATVFRLALSRPVIGQKCCAVGYADMASGQPVAGDPNTSVWQGPR